MFLRVFVLVVAFFISVPLSQSAPLVLDLKTFRQEAVRRFASHFPGVAFVEQGIWLTEGVSAGGKNESTLAQVYEFSLSGITTHAAVGFGSSGEWFIRFADFQKKAKIDPATLHYRYSDTFTGKIKATASREEIDRVLGHLQQLFPKAEVDAHFAKRFKMILVGNLEPSEWFSVYEFFVSHSQIVDSLFPAPPGRWLHPFQFLPSQYLGDALTSQEIDLNQLFALPQILKAQGKILKEEWLLPPGLRSIDCTKSLE